MSKLDEMGRRVDELERDLGSLAAQAGMEAASPTKSTEKLALSLSPSGPPTSGAVEI